MVETERLVIIPLNYDQLRLYLKGNGKLERELRLTVSGRNVSEEVKQSVELFVLPTMKNIIDDHYLFYTFWLVVEKTSGRIVGELGFKGKPGDKKEIEIGYGTFFEHRRKNMMTEAVGGMIDWATAREDVAFILAEADENNIASIRVLQKNSFEFFEKKEKMLWWKKKVIPRPDL
jgi:ribosomal-protein-alanine N-acetyltransferase